MDRSEIMGCSGTTRNALNSSCRHGKISLYHEKESNYGCNDGRNADNRRCGSYPSDIRIYCQGTMQERRAKVQKSRQELESQTGGLEKLHRQPTRRQKIKPDQWLATTKISAAGQFLTVWTTSRNAPRFRYPVFIVHGTSAKSKVSLVQQGVGMR